MGITTTTHLNFRGTARQGLDFYRSVFGGTIHAVTYGDFGMPADLPGADIIKSLAASAWSPGFGMLTDRFGATGVIDVRTPHAG